RPHIESAVNPAAAPQRSRNNNGLSHLLRVSYRELYRRAAAEAVTDDVRAFDLQMIEQRGSIVGKILKRNVAVDVGRPAVSLHLDGDNFVRLGKLIDKVFPLARYRHKCS